VEGDRKQNGKIGREEARTRGSERPRKKRGAGEDPGGARIC